MYSSNIATACGGYGDDGQLVKEQKTFSWYSIMRLKEDNIRVFTSIGTTRGQKEVRFIIIMLVFIVIN